MSAGDGEGCGDVLLVRVHFALRPQKRDGLLATGCATHVGLAEVAVRAGVWGTLALARVRQAARLAGRRAGHGAVHIPPPYGATC